MKPVQHDPRTHGRDWGQRQKVRRDGLGASPVVPRLVLLGVVVAVLERRVSPDAVAVPDQVSAHDTEAEEPRLSQTVPVNEMVLSDPDPTVFSEPSSVLVP